VAAGGACEAEVSSETVGWTPPSLSTRTAVTPVPEVITTAKSLPRLAMSTACTLLLTVFCTTAPPTVMRERMTTPSSVSEATAKRPPPEVTRRDAAAESGSDCVLRRSPLRSRPEV
jgi:hypothetical protein